MSLVRDNSGKPMVYGVVWAYQRTPTRASKKVESPGCSGRCQQKYYARKYREHIKHIDQLERRIADRRRLLNVANHKIANAMEILRQNIEEEAARIVDAINALS